MPAHTTVAMQIRTLRLAIRQLDRTVDQLASTLAAQPKNVAAPRRKLRLTPERRTALKLQGQYLGHMRGLKPRQKTQVKRIRAAKGIRAAIAAAKRLAA